MLEITIFIIVYIVKITSQNLPINLGWFIFSPDGCEWFQHFRSRDGKHWNGPLPGSFYYRPLLWANRPCSFHWHHDSHKSIARHALDGLEQSKLIKSCSKQFLKGDFFFPSMLIFFFLWQVFITYVDLLNTARERQEDLQATYYFLCQCIRCVDRSELELQRSMLCPNIKCGEPVPIFQSVSFFVLCWI